MRGKKLLVSLLTAGLFLVGTGTAQAWDLIHERHGYDRVTLRAWTRGYGQVAFVADHAGTRIDVQITTTCANGDYFQDNLVGRGRAVPLHPSWPRERPPLRP